MAKRVFISYEHDSDKDFINGLRGMLYNDNIELDFYDESVREPIDSHNAEYIKRRIREKISRASVTLVIIGRNTHTSRWVKWEIDESYKAGNNVVYMRRKGDYTSSLPESFKNGKRIYDWNIEVLKIFTR